MKHISRGVFNVCYYYKVRNFVNDEWYHIYNRGVERRHLFLDSADYARFLFHLYECNDIKALPDTSFSRRIKSFNPTKDARTRYVDMLAFAIMPNHFHLLLRSLRDNGISDFMHKASLSYAKGFNAKHSRVGALFQGTFKAKLVNDDAYLSYLLAYIFTNPLNLYQRDWREVGVRNIPVAKNFLTSYQYTNYGSAIGLPNSFGFVASNNALGEVGGRQEIEWLVSDMIGGGGTGHAISFD